MWTQTLWCLPHRERIFGLRPCGWLTETERVTSLQKALAVRPGKLPPLRSLKCLPPRTRRFLLGSLRMTLLASLDLSQQTPGTAGNLVSGPVCEAANLVFTSGAKLVTGVGNIDSDAVVFAAPGTYFWVQTL